ncbi:hypothetical protein ILUMI_27493 [Ignelater luminosus]|uniref:Uncharacterized protein n=1 Tax=Ignelater luminosus TaxID=2038154 RepID=A0A8K0FVM2_IGNLU|nr:hypothetical protein ILUMI_27493 [Ignelater luminosus]
METSQPSKYGDDSGIGLQGTHTTTQQDQAIGTVLVHDGRMVVWERSEQFVRPRWVGTSLGGYRTTFYLLISPPPKAQKNNFTPTRKSFSAKKEYRSDNFVWSPADIIEKCLGKDQDLSTVQVQDISALPIIIYEKFVNIVAQEKINYFHDRTLVKTIESNDENVCFLYKNWKCFRESNKSSIDAASAETPEVVSFSDEHNLPMEQISESLEQTNDGKINDKGKPKMPKKEE